MFAMAIDVSRGVDVGRIAERAMLEVGMTLKELAAECGYPDASQLCRAFRGQAPLDLWRLRHAPRRWWPLFLSKLASALIIHWFEDIQSEFRMAKADIRDHEDRERKRA